MLPAEDRTAHVVQLQLENWKRPQREVDFLMGLLKQYLVAERPEIMRQNIRFRVIGRRSELAAEVVHEIEETERLSSANTGLTLALPSIMGRDRKSWTAFVPSPGESRPGISTRTRSTRP